MPEALARATGRRKEAVCRACLLPGEGRWTINGRPFEDYFANATHRMIVTEPLRLTETEGRYDIIAKIEGGGVAGQAGALRHAISRCLIELDPDLRPILKRGGFLTTMRVRKSVASTASRRPAKRPSTRSAEPRLSFRSGGDARLRRRVLKASSGARRRLRSTSAAKRASQSRWFASAVVGAASVRI